MKGNDFDEEVSLLKDWDIARFFPLKFDGKQKETSEKEEKKDQRNERKQCSSKNVVVGDDNNDEDMLKMKKTRHRRMESESKPFLRGFRRENSDFFPLSSRHSTYLASERNLINQPLRSSALFTSNNNNRLGGVVCGGGSSSFLKKIDKGEPILTDFVVRNHESIPSLTSTSSTSSLNNQKKWSNNDNNANWNSKSSPMKEDLSKFRPRREKTESDIVLRQSSSEAKNNFIKEKTKEFTKKITNNEENDNFANNTITCENYLQYSQVI